MITKYLVKIYHMPFGKPKLELWYIFPDEFLKISTGGFVE